MRPNICCIKHFGREILGNRIFLAKTLSQIVIWVNFRVVITHNLLEILKIPFPDTVSLLTHYYSMITLYFFNLHPFKKLILKSYFLVFYFLDYWTDCFDELKEINPNNMNTVITKSPATFICRKELDVTPSLTIVSYFYWGTFY